MNERIKKLRKALGLTQQEFADKISISRGALATYEVGRNEPIDAVISLICREFNVSEDWLRTGEGEMFIQKSEEDELKQAIESMLYGRNPNFKRRLINILASLDDADWLALEEKVLELAEVAKTEMNIAAEVASYEEELRLQAQVEEKLSVSDGHSGIGETKMA